MGRGKESRNESFRRARVVYYGVEKDVPKDEVCSDGRFVYTIMNKPLKDGHEKTGGDI